MARKYSKGSSKKVERAMHKRKRGTLKSGRSGKTVKSRKQAIAIGLSEARRAGAKVPRQKYKKKERFDRTQRRVLPGQLKVGSICSSLSRVRKSGLFHAERLDFCPSPR